MSFCDIINFMTKKEVRSMVLIVCRQRRIAQSVSDIFHYMGVLSYACTPTESLSEISSSYRAVIVIDPHTLPDPRDFVNRMRSYAEHVPIFSVSDSPESREYSDVFDKSYKMAISSARLASDMAQYSRSKGLQYLGDYRLAGIDATADLPWASYFDLNMRFSKTETMILRYLIRSYPMPKRASDILKYAFKPSKRPDVSTIKTHICTMNKKFRAMEDRNLISMYFSEGYVMLTPVMLRNIREAEMRHAEASYNS